MPIRHSNILPSSLHGFFVFPKTFLSSYMAVFRFPQIEKAPNDGVRVLATSFTQKWIMFGAMCSYESRPPKTQKFGGMFRPVEMVSQHPSPRWRSTYLKYHDGWSVSSASMNLKRSCSRYLDSHLMISFCFSKNFGKIHICAPRSAATTAQNKTTIGDMRSSPRKLLPILECSLLLSGLLV